MTNDYFEKSVGSSKKNFVNFVKINTEGLEAESLKDMDFLAHKIAKNMFYYPLNIETAHSDYITLIGMLIKAGVLFKEHKDLVPNENYFNEK